MDDFRYYFALILLMVSPGAFLFWLSVHPGIGFWRSMGTRVTYAVHCALMALVAATLFLARKPLLAVQFGTNPLLIALALPIYTVALLIAMQRRQRLGWRVLVGLPEIAPGDHKSELVTGGIYSRLRHPRYAELMLFMTGHALVANYLAVYVILAFSAAALALVVRLEEKELAARFGEEYERYRACVPRFLPRL